MKTQNENSENGPKKPINNSNGYDEFSMGNEQYDDRFEDNEDDREQYDGKEHPQIENETDVDDEERKDNGGVVDRSSSSGKKAPRKRS